MEIKLFSEIIGQEKALGHLLNIAVSNKIGPAYLFAGIKGVGKTTIALSFAMFLNCQHSKNGDACRQCPSCRKMAGGNHPDLIIIEPEEDKKEISIGQIRDLARTISFAPALGGYRISIIDPAEKMSIEASNAFLKSLEEPPSNNIFILNVKDLGDLPPTIVSRCQKVFFRPIQVENIIKWLRDKREITQERAEIAARLSEGSLSKAEKLAEDDFFLSRAGYISMLQDIINESVDKLFDRAQKFITKNKEKNDSINLMFSVLKSWYRDLLIIKLGVNSEYILNFDLKDRLKKVSNTFTVEGLMRSIDIITRAENDFMANKNLLFLLERAFFGLKNAINIS